MTTTLFPEEVRNLVLRTFRDFWVDDESLESLSEEILVREGKYLGRSYRIEGMMAMWMIEVGILQFYDAEGDMLRTINLLERLEPEPQAMAA